MIAVDPYTCLVSGMHGLSLGGPGPGGAPPGTQFVQGNIGYPGMCVIGPGTGPSYPSLPNIDHPTPSQQNTASPNEDSALAQQQERGQSN